uniref:DExH-box helicase 29 n=1 Tax=Leptobrachium leishanense TaxID=445787 RepID=A0A8C5M760_9ANUR
MVELDLISPQERKRGRGDASPASTGMGSTGRTAKRTRYPRHRKQVLELRSGDSGVCDLYDTPSPTPSPRASRVPPGPFDSFLSDRLSLQNFRDYGEDCYLFNKSLEGRFLTADCLANQPQLNAKSRCKLVSWLIPVHRHFCLGFESLCLAINILDRFLSCTPVACDCFQLVGVTSLLIACKQVETRPPTVKQLLALCCDAFSKEQLRNLEFMILLKLGFHLGAPTINFFLQHYTLMRMPDGDASVEDLTGGTKTLNVARIIAELSMADYAFNCYPPSLMAICCLTMADRMMGNEVCLQTGGYSPDLLHECKVKVCLLVSLNRSCLQCILPSDIKVDLDNWQCS